MNAGDDIEDPFKLKDLWQTSSFALDSLPPLESVHLELAISGTDLSAFNRTMTDTSCFRYSKRTVRLLTTQL
jgi:hypothetical protein